MFPTLAGGFFKELLQVKRIIKPESNLNLHEKIHSAGKCTGKCFLKSNVFFLFLFYLKNMIFLKQYFFKATLCWFVTYLDVIKIAHKKVGGNGTIQEHVAIFLN